MSWQKLIDALKYVLYKNTTTYVFNSKITSIKLERIIDFILAEEELEGGREEN